ncbi:MAG: site-2 protease family protein [Acidobacteriales bacterium]|nr:site-2 protease family protein [Terriglobales bacterium]
MSEQITPFASSADYYRPVEVFVPRQYRPRYWLHLLLLIGTVFTTMVVGARMQYNFNHGLPAFYLEQDSLGLFPVMWLWAQPARFLLGLPFAASLMVILLSHEMGHYLFCRHYGVNATLPFFIPAPTLFGTLGAFIRIRSSIRSRSALFDIGIAGPIAGFVVACGVLAIALGLSKPLPGYVNPSDQLSYPLIFRLMHDAFRVLGLSRGTGALPFDRVLLHPMAVAAWVGMFATSLNLLPGGQLDGGHIVFAIYPRAHRYVSRITILALIPMALYFWVGWLLWAVLLRISGMRHPVVAEYPGISRGRRWLALVALLMLIVTLTPAPFSEGSLLSILHR